jgi:hypothetical protein
MASIPLLGNVGLRVDSSTTATDRVRRNMLVVKILVLLTPNLATCQVRWVKKVGPIARNIPKLPSKRGRSKSMIYT